MRDWGMGLVLIGMLAACEAPGPSTGSGVPVEIVPYSPPPADASETSAEAGDSAASTTPQLNMSAACRAAASNQFAVRSDALSVSSPERTSLGYVAFGQAIGSLERFECSFDSKGNLRAVRAV